jgi:hypothetical protein
MFWTKLRKICLSDNEVIDALDLAAGVGYLQLQFLDTALAARIAAVIRRVAEAEVKEERNELVDEEWQDSWSA